MTFKDYSEFMLPPLALPLNGKQYVIPKPSLDVGLRLTHAFESEGDDSSLFAAPVEEQWRLVLGSAYDEMAKDNAPIEFVSRAFLTALADFQGGRMLAEATWEVGTDPEAVKAWLETRTAPPSDTPTDPPALTSTASETSTP